MTGTRSVLDSPRRETAAARRRRRTAAVRKFIFGVISLVIIGLAALCGYTHSSPMDLPKLFGFGAEMIQAGFHHVPPFKGQKRVNILVLGTDVNFVDKGIPRSDTMKLVTLDLDKDSIAILSIPRDTWVAIPGHRHSKINSVYQRGGDTEQERIAYTRKFLSGFLGEISGQPVPIDYFVRIQTGGFKRIVDALGGVEIDVEKKMDYDDNYQNLYIHLKPGRQRLNGRQAMGYVRFRHDADGDYGRMRRQDQFIRALVAQINTPQTKRRLPGLLGPMMSMMVTNLSLNDIRTIKNVASRLGMESIHTVPLPTEPGWEGPASVVKITDPEAARLAVSEVLNGPRTTVVVLNGTGNKRLGRKVSDAIDASTYNVVGVGTLPEPVPVTSVITRPRMKDEAQVLATKLGITQIDTESAPPADASFGRHTAPPPPSEVTLVLGQDYTAPEAHAEL